MIFYRNSSIDPHFNMAMEEVLLREAGEEPLFLLWQNSPAVIVGRNQNVLEEVNLLFAEEHGIQVVRRLTGGGAVYHDLGNLNYTFILPEPCHSSKDSPLYDFRLWTKPVLSVLQKLGVSSEFSGRNDLTIEGKKFSGNAQVRMGNHLLHHGTILFHADFQMMSGVLNVDREKFHSKGVASVRSRVVNLSDYLMKGFGITEFQESLLAEISSEYSLRHEEFSPDILEKIVLLNRKKYSTHSWNFGKSPKSNVKAEKRYSWGKICIELSLNGCRITDAAVSGDFFAADSPESFSAKLIGLQFDPKMVSDRISNEDITSFIPSFSKKEFITLLFDPAERVEG